MKYRQVSNDLASASSSNALVTLITSAVLTIVQVWVQLLLEQHFFGKLQYFISKQLECTEHCKLVFTRDFLTSFFNETLASSQL